MSSSVAVGFVIAVILAVAVAWIVFRGGRRLLTWPVVVLFAALAVTAVALMLGW